jgi:hypothetical protein
MGTPGFFFKDIKMIGTGKVSPDNEWVNAGSITSEQAALAVDGRDSATAEALDATKIIKINNARPGAYAFLFRFRADGNADLDSVLELYAARGTDHYHRIATLTVTTGTQDTDISTIHFCDTIDPTNEDDLFDGSRTSLADMIAQYYVRTLGFDKFLFVCSDLDSPTIYVDYCRLYDRS